MFRILGTVMSTKPFLVRVLGMADRHLNCFCNLHSSTAMAIRRSFNQHAQISTVYLS